MLRHADIWQAIDRVAASHGYSPSGLARRAGLDPTTFNKSKRVARDGRARWPSTESIAKILEATGASLAEFVAYAGGAPGGAKALRRIPAIGFSQAGSAGLFDASGLPCGGLPSGAGWDEMPFPEIDDPHLYALQIGDERLAPFYRAGDTLVVSPSAGLRHGDRVVVRTTAGEVMARQLVRRGNKKVELAAFGAAQPDLALGVEAVAFVHRIVWTSQ